uniref:Guanine nucleotide-binding protein-like 3 N-terminal domain-containing protein n=1 Tax=Trypanosoma congolense (strain IL3000) TaxID=1068625 RepID=G0UYM4_TRYCI|nr:conserved hypothetical protein [Trypanosoma congolense IL3000]
MPKTRCGPSKRVSSRQRHKVERKKREHKRDVRRAAKALKKSGLGPKRKKRTRELAKLALKVSNAHPDKETILQKILQAREQARIERGNRRAKSRGGDNKEIAEEAKTVTKPQQYKKNILYIPAHESNNFSYQFNKTMRELVFPTNETSLELPSAAYVVTLDARCAAQCVPWGLLDAILHESNAYKESGGTRKVLILFALTKSDLVSAPALISQISLLADALSSNYIESCEEAGSLKNNEILHFAFCPVSSRFAKSVEHLTTVLKRFLTSDNCSKPNKNSNLTGKLCCFIVGLPNTGRKTLRRILLKGNNSNTSAVTVSAAQLQTVSRCDDGLGKSLKFVFPNAKEITLLQFPEDSDLLSELNKLSGSEIIFKPLSFVERLTDPEVVGYALFDAVLDKIGLFQSFCQRNELSSEYKDDEEKLGAASRFFRGLGVTVRRKNGFYVSPFLVTNVGTMGKISSSSLTASVSFTSRQQSTKTTPPDASYSNANPCKLVRVPFLVAEKKHKKRRNVKVKRADHQSIAEFGARIFVCEIHEGKNVPWAVMRSAFKSCLTMSDVEHASTIFDLSLCRGKQVGTCNAAQSSAEHLSLLVDSVSSLLQEYLPFLPNNVIEFRPDAFVAPIHNLSPPNESEGTYDCTECKDAGEDLDEDEEYISEGDEESTNE